MNIHARYLPGCIGRVVELHASFSARTVGVGVPFEAKVATELSAFCLRFALARTQRGAQWGKEVNEQLFTFGGP